MFSAVVNILQNKNRIQVNGLEDESQYILTYQGRKLPSKMHAGEAISVTINVDTKTAV